MQDANDATAAPRVDAPVVDAPVVDGLWRWPIFYQGEEPHDRVLCLEVGRSRPMEDWLFLLSDDFQRRAGAKMFDLAEYSCNIAASGRSYLNNGLATCTFRSTQLSPDQSISAWKKRFPT